MRNGRIVIGVVGASRGMDTIDQAKGDAILELARAVGECVTDKQDILLTGGEPKTEPKLVRDVAMISAKDKGSRDYPARLISVLRKPESSKESVQVPSIRFDDGTTYKHLVVQTDMKDARNFFDGKIPDVLIVIYGGVGTLSEIAFAVEDNTPVVFLEQKPQVNTLEKIRSVSRKDLVKMLGRVQKRFTQVNPEGLAERALNFVHSADHYIAQAAEDAADIAATLGRTRPSANTLPEYPVHPEMQSPPEMQSRYEEEIEKLAK